MLLPLVKSQKERDEKQRIEKYHIGDRNPLIFVEELPNVKQAIESRIGDYAVFNQIQSQKQEQIFDGGSIPDAIFTATLIDERQNEIRLKLRQRYDQPGPRLHYVEVEMRYDPKVSTNDLEFVRKQLKESGLSEITER